MNEIEPGVVQPQRMVIRQPSLGPGPGLRNVDNCGLGLACPQSMPFGVFVPVVLQIEIGQGGRVAVGLLVKGRVGLVGAAHHCYA